MMARLFDSKHQAYFCLPKPCPFGEHGEDSCCPSSFSPALCEAMVLISSAPHVCTQHLCPWAVQGVGILLLATYSLPLREVDAGQRCSWRLQPISSVQPGSFHLPPSQPQLSPFPGSCPHLLRGLPALKLSSFSFWFFLPLSVRCFGALLEAEWSGSFSFFQSVIYSLSPFAITQQYGCPMIYFYEIETRKLNEILGMKSTLFTILNILGTSLTV